MAAHAQTFDRIMQWQVAVPKDRVIFDEGDASEALYRLDRGCVRLQINGDDGRRQIFAFLFAGDIFGMGLNDRRAASAEAVSACQLTRYPLASMPSLLASRPQAATDVFGATCALLSAVSHHLAMVTRAPAEERLTGFLSWLAGRLDCLEAVDLPMSRRDIADYLSLAPETLSRTFSRLEAQGLLFCDGTRRVVFARPARRCAAGPGEPRTAA